MKNIIVLGSGRSGTSAVAGMFAKSGYFMGSNLWPAQPGNPKGFFEDEEINLINEELLASVLPSRPILLGNIFYRDRPTALQRWLAEVPSNACIRANEQVVGRIKTLVANTPWCFKDPRFCHTIRVWRPFLKDVVFICVFREPEITVSSILKECRAAPYLSNLKMNREKAYRVWEQSYSAVLRQVSGTEAWHFLHYEQVLQSEKLVRIASTWGAVVDVSFIDRRLKRTVSPEDAPPSAQKVYKRLCELAGY